MERTTFRRSPSRDGTSSCSAPSSEQHGRVSTTQLGEPPADARCDNRYLSLVHPTDLTSWSVKTLEDAPWLDFFSEAFQADPQPIVDALRKESWLVRTPVGGLVIDREHVQALLADRRLRSSLLDFMRMQGVTEGLLYEIADHSLLAREGEDHTRLRKLVSRAFTPRAVDVHRSVMRQ